MALSDKLSDRTQPLLEPGEQIQYILPAQGGPNPLIFIAFGAVGALFGASRITYLVIAFTDRNLVLLESGMSGTSPKSVLKRLPRDTPIGPLKGMWSRIEIDGQKVWIHRKFHKHAQAATAAT